MEPLSDKTQAFYRWVDAEGRLHVVSSLDAVPAAYRAKAERLTLQPSTPSGTGPRDSAAPAWKLEPASFALGFGAALVLSLLFRALPGSWRGFSRVVLVAGVALLLTGLYLGAIRRAAGSRDAGPLASPSALIEDAKSAVEKLNTRQRQQDEELRKLQAEGR